eukprot:11776387-Heterocapsa_arctica.AAC.1
MLSQTRTERERAGRTRCADESGRVPTRSSPLSVLVLVLLLAQTWSLKLISCATSSACCEASGGDNEDVRSQMELDS